MITQKCRSKAITVGAAIAFTAAGLAFARAADLPQEYAPPPPVSQLPPPGYGAAPVYPPAVYPQPIYPPAAYADPVYVPAPLYVPAPVYGPVVGPYPPYPYPYRYARGYRGPIGPYGGHWYRHH